LQIKISKKSMSKAGGGVATLSNLIARKFGRRETKLILTLAVILVNLCVLLSIAGTHGATFGKGQSTISSSQSFQDPWLNENWAERRPITINNSNNFNVLENYQVKINLDYDNYMRADFGDLRFTDNGGVTKLSYWIENYEAGENAVVWVRVPYVPAGDNSTIYMYYGNRSAGTESNGPTVFEFFDNFDNSTSFSTVAYPYGDPYIAYPSENNFVEFGNNGSEEYVMLGCYDEGELRENLNLPFSNYEITVEWRTGYDPFSFDNADYTNYDEIYGASSITPKRLIVVNDEKIFEKDNKLFSYSSTTEVDYTGAIDNLYLSVGSSGSYITYYTYFDLALVSKSTDPEPVTSVGEEELNMTPSAPNLLEPENNWHENIASPIFRWENSTDPEGDSVIYTLQIDNEQSFSGPSLFENVEIVDNKFELPAENALPDGMYYWRVAARDMVNPENWSEIFTSTIDTIPPLVPTLQSPSNGAITNDNTPILEWIGIDIENSFPITYDLQIDNDNNFLTPEFDVTGLTDNTYTTPFDLADGRYSWRVRARDNAGNVGSWSVAWTIVVDTIPPDVPILAQPMNGARFGNPNVQFSWTGSESAVAYQIQIDNESSFLPAYIHENQLITDNSYSYTFARAGTYYWRVRARDQVGNWSGWSDNFRLTIDVAVLPGTSHNAIRIENNDFFNLDNGVLAGSGSDGDPM
jgi:hypothetical protein